MLTDGLAHGFARLGVGNRFPQSTLGDPDRTGSDVDTADFKAASRHIEALALFPTNQAEFRVTLVAIVNQLARVDALVTQLLEFLAVTNTGQIICCIWCRLRLRN